MDSIQCERQGPVTVITLNRPAAMNALNYEANQALIQCFKDFDADDTARVAVVTGAGDKAFCSGADMKTFTMAYATKPAPEFRQMFIDGYGFGGITRGLKINKPIIAAINGYAVGGGFELSLAMDVRFCTPESRFGIQDVAWGMHPCDGGSIRLPKLVGLGNAMEIILSGELFDAQHAHRIGLVNRIIPKDQILSEAIRYAHMLASRGKFAQRFVKDVEYRAIGLTLEEGIRVELRSFSDLSQTDDFAEGVTAFKEKRAPRFVEG